MISTGMVNWQNALFLLILAVAPIIGSFLISLLNYMVHREIPPILPQINSQSFSQALVAIVVLGLIRQQTSQIYLLLESLVIVFLFFIVLFHSIIEQKQQTETQKHVKEVLSEKLSSKSIQGIDFTHFLEMAESMVEIDYLPESKTNQWSDYPRREKRILFIRLINSCLEKSAEQKIDINQSDLLVPEEKRGDLNRIYVWITVVSLVIYVVGIALSLFGQS